MSKGFLKLGSQFGTDPNINPDPPSVVNPFFLLSNGVTIKLKGGYPVGTTGKADGDPSGKVYTAVDNTALFALDPATDDYTSVCTTLCTDFVGLFEFTTFNQDISSWDTSNVTTLERTFRNAVSFNQNISFWDVSNVTDMSNTFNNADSFNQPIGVWNVGKVTTFSGCFNVNSGFNQPLNNWNVSSATNMDFMFRLTNFNQPLNNWDVSNVTNMQEMFRQNTSFNQDLSSWCVEQIPTEPVNFDLGATSWVLPRPNWGDPC